jgi:hypothetical protein
MVRDTLQVRDQHTSRASLWDVLPVGGECVCVSKARRSGGDQDLSPFSLSVCACGLTASGAGWLALMPNCFGLFSPS